MYQFFRDMSKVEAGASNNLSLLHLEEILQQGREAEESILHKMDISNITHAQLISNNTHEEECLHWRARSNEFMEKLREAHVDVTSLNEDLEAMVLSQTLDKRERTRWRKPKSFPKLRPPKAQHRNHYVHSHEVAAMVE
eukprot:CAMPEP_0196573436 /NCGR_PEP_ID=MMETSP1081-20130531/3334_1 /TAXON_ID=36882 /ORGANISM="Pyramimonas amylifera, Strain CCMP720" /LENGTH=138 /DNA_ID=CAMNT_0041891135 /DNA_START=81 /DNA_END=498 /DNA_ORIENTATION=-